MNITCALTKEQIEKLFAKIYRDLFDSLNNNQEVNTISYMNDLFNTIESKSDVDTAAKFLQNVPSLMHTAIGDYSLANLKIDDGSIRPLIGKFLNPENGLLETLKYFRPETSVKDLKNAVIAQGVDANTPSYSEEETEGDSGRYKPSSAFTSTMQQFVSINPKEKGKLFVEEIDQNRVRIYNTLEKIKLELSSKTNKITGPIYQGRTLYLKAIPLSKLANKDKTTADLYAKGNAISAKGIGPNLTKDIIALVVSDEQGNIINFSKDGDIQSAEEGGLPVYQFLRNATYNSQTDVYEVKDIYGIESKIQSVEDILTNYADKAYDMTLDQFKEYLKTQGESYDELYKLKYDEQQAQFKALYELKNEILTGKEKVKLLDIMGISNGIPDFYDARNLELSQFLELSDNIDINYSFSTVKEKRDGFEEGTTVININNQEFMVDRKNMPDYLIEKIASVLSDPNINAFEKYNFYEQFSNNKINATRKKLFVSYNKERQELILEYKTDAKNPKRFKVGLSNPAAAKTIIIQALSNESGTYNANMKNNADLWNNVEFTDYVDGKLVTADYREFLKKINPNITFTPNADTSAFNSYFAFRVNDKLSAELKKAKQQVQEEAFTNTDSAIRQAKDALVDKLKTTELKGQVIGSSTPRSFEILIENKPYKVWYEPNLSVKDLPTDGIVTFTVGDDGKITDVVSVYDSKGKKIGQIAETDYKAGEVERTPETKKEEATKADNEYTDPKGTESPAGKTRLYTMFNRSAELPSNVTREEVDAAQEWWNNSPLSKFIELEHMANIVNSDVYARFIIAGKRLQDTKIQLDTATGGSAVDLYHEAWHAFSQLYLTKKQKTKLYAETRKRLNNYDLSPLEVEEILAEEYRTYAKDPKAVGDAPIRNTIFRRIWNIIKALFGKRSTQEDLFERLFFASKNPKLLNKYAPLVDNAMFNVLNRDRGVMDVESNELALSFQDSMTVSSQIDSALSQLIDELYEDRVAAEKEGLIAKATRNGTIKLLTDDTNKAVAYNAIKGRFEEKLKYFKAQLEAADEDDFNKVTSLKDKVRILEATIKNWGDAKTGVIKFHIDNSTFDLIKQKYIEIESDDEVSEDDDNSAPENVEESEKFSDKKVGEKSLLQLAEKETIYILKSLFKLSNNKQVVGKLGFPELADFSKTWNIVTKVIGGEKDPVKMYKKLNAAIDVFPELKQLIANKIPDPTNINDLEEFNIKAAFWQDFKKTRLKYIQLTIDNSDGKGYSSEVTDASIDFKNIVDKFSSDFRASQKTTYINKTTDNKSILNLDKLVEDFDRKSFSSDIAIPFANALGIGLQDLSALKKELNNRQEHYGLPSLFNIVKEIHKISKDEKASTEYKNFVKKFKSNPVGALYGEIPAGIYKDTTSEKNIIKRLAELQRTYGTNYSSFSVLNPEKNLVNEFIEDNTVSLVVDAINNVKNGKDLWTGDSYQYMSYLNPNINSFTLESQILKNIFFNDGVTLNARKGDSKIELSMVGGTQIVSDNAGANTTSLDVQSKYIQELNMMLKSGITEFMRHASKSSSFGMKASNGITGGLGKAKSNLYVDIEMFGPNGNAYDYAINNIFIGYMQAELKRIQTFKANKELFKNYQGYNRNVGTKENPIYAGEVFTAFDKILGDATISIEGKEKTVDIKQLLIDEVKDGNLKDYLNKNPEIKAIIANQISEYFNGQSTKNYNKFSESPYYDPALMNKLNVFTTLEDSDKHELLVKAYTMNSWIHNFETASLIYGDVVQYNHAKQEMHKRNTGSTSGGRGFMDDIYTQNFLQSNLIKKSSYGYKLAKDSNFGEEYNKFNYTNTFNTAIMQDVKRDSVYVKSIEKALRDDYKKSKLSKDEIDYRIKKELKKYTEMEEGDGQGFITIDAYRNLRLAESNWSAEQEKLFQDVINDRPVKAEDVVRFFPVYKLQHFGHLANTALPVNAMHKFALMPLIPSMIKGSDLESLHHQMMKSNIQYATFQTGSKVGSITSQVDKDGKAVADQIYDDNGLQKKIKSDIKFTPNTIYLAYLKNVTSVPTKYKGKTVFSTQLRKLILEGLYENGEIVEDYKKYAPEIKAYEDAIANYTNLLKKELLEEIGYEKVDGKYVSGDISKFMDVVQKELERKDLPEHLVKYIQVGKDNKITKDLSLHLLSDDIEKMLVALVEKRIVKQKVKGEALVQVASSMSNGLWDSGFKFDKANTTDIEKYLGSNNLPFYYPGENGKTVAMKVAIALQGDFTNLLKLKHNDGEVIGTRERLNEMIKNDEWLNKGNNRKAITMTAVRIPVQGLNSMEFMEVYEFLDPSAGNIIIPPSEIVAKSGADYDVDKLTTFMPNIDARGQYVESGMDAETLDRLIAASKKKGDKAEMTRLIKLQKAALENKLIDSIRGILELPNNYATLVRPNDTYLLQDVADELVDDSPEYKEFKSISPTEIFEVGYNLHKHEANMVGKDVLGIIALENALHPVLTSLGAALPKTYKHQIWDDDNKVYKELEDVDYEMRLLLNHNKTKDGRISLSGINSVDGKDKIADLFSHLMNGAVDVEKDAWIFFIQANKEIVPVLLSLLKAGVPKKEAVYFVSQPLVKEYARQQRSVKSAYAGITGNGVDSPSFIKYKALQNTLAQTGITFNNDLIKKANRIKMFETLKTVNFNITVKFKNNKTNDVNPKDLLKALNEGSIQKSDISNMYIAGKFKLDYNGEPLLDPDGNKIPVIMYKPVNKKHLLANDNWYYVTQAATEGINQFTENELSKNINDNDKTSPKALAAFLHFLEFEREIKGISNLKRQANPDTKTSKTIQEIIQKVVSLEEAADSSKIEPELAERLLKESILGTFFDKAIVNDVVAPLFTITNNKIVSDFMLDTIKSRGGSITSKFGPGRDGVQAFISTYKNAIINYIYQNKLYEAVNSEEGYPGIPESFNNLDTEEFVDDFMFTLSKHSNLKERFPILEQLTDVTIKNKESGVTTKTITLNNKNAVKGELAEAYYQNLIDLADDNVIKVKDPVENKVISDTFKVLPLMSIYQNGVGNTKYGLSYVLPDDVYFSLLEPGSREFLENNLNNTTLTEIADLLFANEFGQNNYLKSSYTGPRKQRSKGDTQYDSEEKLPVATVSNNKQTIAFGQQPTQQQAPVNEQERIKKVISNTIVDKSQGYTFNLQELNEVKKIFENTNPFNTDPLDSETIKDGRAFEDPSLREYGMSDQQYNWAKNNESILSKLNELLYTDEYSAVNFEDLVSMLIEENTKLVDTAQTSLFDNEVFQQQAPVGEVKEGVEDLFKDKPELSSIGTPEQYSNWLNFLTTQGKLKGTRATEILYHGTDKEFDTFDKTKRGSATGDGYFQDEEQTPIDSLNAFFFSTDSAVSEQYGLLRRVTEVENLAHVLGLTMFNGKYGKDIKKYSPELSAHLKEKQKELTPDELKAYIKQLYQKYDKVSKDLGTGFLNKYNNYTRLGKHLKNLKNKKAEILSGKYVHDSLSKEHPTLGISLYNGVKTGDMGIYIYNDGEIRSGEFDKRNITSLSSQEFDKLIAIGEESYNEGIEDIKALMSKAKITPILYRVLLNVQKPLVKDFEGKPFVNQAYEAGAQYEASKLTNKAAKSKGEYDSVIFKNILDPYMSDNYGVFEPEQVYVLGSKQDIEEFKEFVKGNTQRQTEDKTTDEDVQFDNTVTYKPIGKERQTYTVINNQIFNKNGDEVFKEASVDRNKILANLAVKQGRAVIVEHKSYKDENGNIVPSKYIVNNRDIIISGTTGKVMQWDENNGDRKAIIALAKKKFATESQEPQIDKNMEAFNAEMANNKGRMPKEFIVGESKWVMNDNGLYNLVDKNTGDIFMRNMSMFTGKIVEETTLGAPVNQKQLYNFTKQLASGVKEYKLDQLLALKDISIDEIFDDIKNDKVTTQSQLNDLIYKIIKAIC